MAEVFNAGEGFDQPSPYELALAADAPCATTLNAAKEYQRPLPKRRGR